MFAKKSGYLGKGPAPATKATLAYLVPLLLPRVAEWGHSTFLSKPQTPVFDTWQRGLSVPRKVGLD